MTAIINILRNTEVSPFLLDKSWDKMSGDKVLCFPLYFGKKSSKHR